MTAYKKDTLYLATYDGGTVVATFDGTLWWRLVTWKHADLYVVAGEYLTDVREAVAITRDDAEALAHPARPNNDDCYAARDRLRAQLKPPRPTLPTTPGSIVTDDEDDGWVLTAKGWRCFGYALSAGVADAAWLTEHVVSVEEAGRP